jgi:leucyl-tRNA---protein transferase
LSPEPYIFDQFEADAVPPELMDSLWASGWRHFGSRFFRYSIQFEEASGAMQSIQPLRIDLAGFRPSKSQRRTLSANTDVSWEIVPARLGEDVQDLFQRHKQRFISNVPESIFDFISHDSPSTSPCQCLEFRAMLGGRLMAASFLAVGKNATSSIYGIFDPDFARRSPGTLTMLKEIEHSTAMGCQFYYPGYATREKSAYDYKKRFAALERLDWEGEEWLPMSASGD